MKLKHFMDNYFTPFVLLELLFFGLLSFVIHLLGFDVLAGMCSIVGLCIPFVVLAFAFNEIYERQKKEIKE